MSTTGYQLTLGRQLAGFTTPISTALAAQKMPDKNPKSALMEFFQKRQGTPTFSTTGTTQPPLDPNFKCVLICPPVSNPMGPEKVIAETVFEGFGRSKKLAEQAACIAALELYHTKRLIGGFKPSLMEGMTSPGMEQPVYVSAPTPVPSMHGSDTYAPMHTTPSPVPMHTSPTPMQQFSQCTTPAPSPLPNGEVYTSHPVVTNEYSAIFSQMGGTMSPVRKTYYVEEDQSMDGFPPNGQKQGFIDVEDYDDVNIDLDNSDIERRKEALWHSPDLQQIKTIGMEALDEIVQLRQELLEAKRTICRKNKLAQKMMELASNLAQL